MKNLKNSLRYSLYLLLVIGFYSCTNPTDYTPENINKYEGWIVIQKPYRNPLINNYTRYSLEIYKDSVGKKIYLYEHHYKLYELGDTIKACY